MLKEIKWSAPEFEHREKGVSWYWLTAIAAITIIGIALWAGNFLFAFFVMIAETLIIFWAHQKPAEIEFKLDENGLTISDKKSYPYETLAGFAVRGNEVIFRQKRRLTAYLKIIAGPADIGRIKSFLSDRLPEIEYEESLIEHLARILRF